MTGAANVFQYRGLSHWFSKNNLLLGVQILLMTIIQIQTFTQIFYTKGLAHCAVLILPGLVKNNLAVKTHQAH